MNGTSVMSGIGIVNAYKANQLTEISIKLSCAINEIVQAYDDHFSEFLAEQWYDSVYSYDSKINQDAQFERYRMVLKQYYLECDKEHRESFKLIIKAELMNEFRKLKYHTNDLNKEIDFELNNSQITEWTENNSKIVKDKYDIGEYDDF